MLKKLICAVLSLMIVTAAAVSASAEESGDIGLCAPTAVLMDSATGKVLYEKNSHERRPCASITKVMTLCLVFEAIESGRLAMNDMITASPMAAAQDGSDIWLVEGEQMSVNDLLKAVIVVSANDAAVALAEAVSGTEASFVAAMNDRAKQLSMNDTEFKNCNGLDEDGHLTSAYDVALMSRELMKHEQVFEYTGIWLDYIRDGATQLVNTNRLVKSYDGITGLKTGTTSLAGACISATAKRGDMHLIAVVLGDKTTDERFSDAEKLLDYGFASFGAVTPELPDDMISSIAVKNGMENEVDVRCIVSGSFLVKNGDEGNVGCTVNAAPELEAPVKQGQRVGTVVYTCNGEALGQFPVVAANEVKKTNFLDVFILLMQSLV